MKLKERGVRNSTRRTFCKDVALGIVAAIPASVALAEHGGEEDSTKRSRLKKSQQISNSSALYSSDGLSDQILSVDAIGCHKIYTGDCLRVLKSDQVPEMDLVIADPPYWKVIGEQWDYLPAE